MTERQGEFSPHRPREVRKLSKNQYENIWNGYASARRALYQYEKPPWESREPYNIWEDMADHLDPTNARKIVDLGTNDGYFHSVLRHKGFNGSFVGVDIEGAGLSAVEYIAHNIFPEAEVKFLQGDAQNLKNIIDDDSTPIAVAAFLPYHVEKPSRLMSELHRILEPGGIAEVSSRDITNQLDTWVMARQAAHNNGFAFPQELNTKKEFISGVPTERISVYSHFNINQTRQSLNDSKRFNIIHEHVQNKDLWIPTTRVGLFDIVSAIESLLPYTEKIGSGEKPTPDDMDIMFRFIDSVMSRFIISQSVQEKGWPVPYYKSHVTQGFFVVEAIK